MKSIYLKVIFFTFLFVNSTNLFSQKINSSSIYTDGYVTTMADDSNNVYVGGRFSSVGHKARSISLLDTLGLKEFNFPSLTSGFAYAIVPDMKGGWYLGGKFEMEGVKNLVHILSNHQVDQNFTPTPIGAISSLVLDGNRLLIGGSFTQICNVERSFLAAVDAMTGKLLDWNPQPNGSISTMLKSGNKLYLSGTFTQIGNGLSKYFGTLDLVTGKNIPSISTNGYIHAMDQDSLNVYIAGEFAGAQGFVTGSSALFSDSSDTPLTNFPVITSPANFVSKCKIKTAIPDGFGGWIIGGMFEYKGIKHVVHIKANGEVDTLINLRFNGFNSLIVNSLVLKGATLYIGGSFSRVNEFTRNNLLAIDVNTGKILDWNPNSSGPIYSMLLDSNSMYVGGNFSTMGYKTNPNFARIDINKGALLPSLAMSAPVNTMVKSNDKLYVGGTFHNQGLYTGSLALMSSNSDVPNFNFPTLTGKVNCVVSDKNGGWYVGGDFKNANIRNLIHILPNNRIDTLFNSDPGGEIKTLSVYKDALYAGGNFNSIGGIQSPYFVKLELTTGKGIPTNIDVDGPINAIAFSGDTLYVGGNFQKFGTCSTSNFAIMDMNSGSCLSEIYLNGQVSFMEQNKSQVFLGGKFFGYQGLKSGSLTSYPIDSDKFSANFPFISGSIEKIISDQNGGWYLGGKFSVDDKANLIHVLSNNTIDPSFTSYTAADVIANHIIYDLVLDNDRLIVGGNFTMIAGQQQSFLAAVNKNSGDLLNWKPNVNAMVKSVVIDNNAMYVGGYFTQFNGQNVEYFVKADKNNLDILPTVRVNSAVTCLQQDQSTIYVGGFFKGISGYLTGPLAVVSTQETLLKKKFPELNGLITTSIPDGKGGWYLSGTFKYNNFSNLIHIYSDYSIDQNFNPNPQSGIIYSLHLDGDVLYVGGNFTKIYNTSRNNLAAINLSTNTLLKDFKPDVFGIVRTIQAKDSLLFIGGTFQQIDQQNRRAIAALNKVNGKLDKWNPDPVGAVNTMKIMNNTLYVAGSFSQMSGMAISSMAKFDLANLGVSAWTSGVVGEIETMDFDANSVYVGGMFNEAGNQTRNYLAQFNMSDGNLTAWDPNPSDYVKSLKVIGDRLIVGGMFNEIDGVSQKFLASFNRADGKLVKNWDLAPGGYVYMVNGDGNDALIGGGYTTFKDYTRNCAFSMTKATGDVTSWNPSLNGFVNCITISGSTAYIGGDFNLVGDSSRVNIAQVNLTSGEATSWKTNLNGDVYAITTIDTLVYVGGSFNQVASKNRFGIAAISSKNGNILSDWSPNQGGGVKSIAYLNNRLFLAGEYVYSNAHKRSFVMAFAKNNLKVSTWNPSPSNTVYALDVHDNHAYIGGEFTSLNGTYSAYVAKVNLIDGNPMHSSLSVDGAVQGIKHTGNSVYLVGDFKSMNNKPLANIGSFNIQNESVNYNWLPNPNGLATNFISDDTTLFMTGNFDYLKTSDIKYLVASSLKNQTLDSWNPEVTGFVDALEIDKSSLYFVGSFETVMNQNRKGFAEISLSNGKLSSFDPKFNSSCTTLKIAAGKLYIGGTFSSIGTFNQKFIASFDLASKSLIKNWDPKPNYYVSSFNYDGKNLMLVGEFSYFKTEFRNRLFSISKSTGLINPWSPKVSALIKTLKVGTNSVYIGGEFQSVSDKERNFLAEIRLSDGQATDWNPSSFRSVNAMEIVGDKVYVAGDFQSIGNQPRNYLAAISRKNGQVLNWNPSAGDKVLQISHSNNKFFVTGEFQSMNNVSRSGLFAFSKRTGRITSFNPKAFSTVEVIEPSDSSIYIGGTISKVGTIDVGNVAEIDLKTSLLTDWRPVINNKVTGIKKWKNKIFVSGNFDIVAGNYQPFLAALDAKTAKLIDWKPNPSDVVNKIYIDDSTMYVGGNFQTISSQNRSYIASYNLTDLSLTNWKPSLDNQVSEIKSTKSNLYIGGAFGYIDGNKRSMIAAFDKQLGLLKPWNPELRIDVKSIEVTDNKVYCVSGDNYYSMDPITAKVDEYSLNFSSYLTALKRVDSTIHIGGTFTTLNTGNSTSELYGGFLTLSLNNEKIVPPSIQLQSITPSVVGRGGVTGITLTGQNFNRNDLFIRFNKTGQAPMIIPSNKLKIIDVQKILFSLDLPNNVDLGQWNVEVVIPNDTVVAINNGLTIQELALGQVKSSIVGFKNMRPNVWQNYSVIVSNTGNTDVKALPVYIAVDTTVSLMFNSKLVVNDPVNGLKLVDNVLSVTRVDSLFGTGASYNVYSMLVANLPGSTSETINFKLLTTGMSPFKVVTWNHDPIFDIALKKPWKDCIDGVAKTHLGANSAFVSSSCGLNALNPSISKLVSEAESNFAKNGKNGGYVSDYMYSFYTAMGSCGENQPLEFSKKLFSVFLKNKSVSCDPLLVRNEEELAVAVVNSMDPNEKQGLLGKGTKKFIFGNELLPYIIRFENKATTSAAAQKVVIIDTIDLKVFDAKTLNLGAFEIGERMVSIPNGLQSYSTIVDFKKEKNILLGLDITFDPTSGQLKWIFTSLDSISKQETTNPTLGFLPPNLKSPEGEGAVSFTIKLLDNIAASQEVNNKAHIYFDNNSVITTNTWSNTIDNKAPVSKVNEIVRDGSSKTFNLTWTVKDDESGVKEIAVYYAVNNGSFKPYATGVKASSLLFSGDKDSTYSFFTIATDSMGNVEKMKNYVEASTSITLGMNELFDGHNIKLSVFPNPTEGTFNLELTSPLFLPSSISIFDIYGKEIVKDKITLQKGLNSFNYTIENTGFYVIEVTIGNKTYRTQIVKG